MGLWSSGYDSALTYLALQNTQKREAVLSEALIAGSSPAGPIHFLINHFQWLSEFNERMPLRYQMACHLPLPGPFIILYVVK
jgi:hypothetical protein